MKLNMEGLARRVEELEQELESLSGQCRLYKSVIENMPVGIHVFDEKGRSLQINIQQKTNLGLKGKVSGNEVFYDLNDKHDAPIVDNDFYGQAYQGKSISQVVEYHPEEADGFINPKEDKRYFRESTFPVYNDQNKLTYVVSVFEDITDRKNTEDALNERVKEQSCLYAISREMLENEDQRELCCKVIEHLTHGMQYPENTAVFIDIEGIQYVSPNYSIDLTHSLTSPLYTKKKKIGHIAVFDTKGQPFALPEEQNMLDSIAYALSAWLDRKTTEEGYREKNVFIQTVLDNLPIGIALNHMNEGDAFYMNKKFSGIYGWPAEELSGIDAFFAKVYPDKVYRKKLIKRVMEDINSGDPEKMHWEGLCATGIDGRQRIIDAVNIPLKEQNTMVSTVIDVTSKEESQKALKELNTFVSNILDYLPVGIVVYDKGFRCLLINNTFKEFMGPLVDHVIGKNAFEVFPFLENSGMRAYMEKAMLGATVVTPDFVHPSRPETNEWFYSVYYPNKDAQGNVIGLISQLTQITDRKRFENQVLESEQRLKYAQQIARLGDFIWDIRSGEVTWSEPMYELLGYDRSEKIDVGKVFNQIHHPDDQPKIEKWLNSVMQSDSDELTPLEYRLFRKGGSLIHCRTMGVVERHGGIAVRVIATVQDITERKMSEIELKKKNEAYININNDLAESLKQIQQINEELRLAKDKAEESDRLKSAFLANMSHEIRTPMNGIVGFSGMILNPGISEKKREHFANIINKCSNQLLTIVNDIMDISIIESGSLKLNLETTDIVEVIKELHTLYMPQATEKGLDLVMDLANCEPLMVVTDNSRLKQVLINLLNNAFKFTDKGHIRFGYEIMGDMLRIFVEDTGKGIEKHMLNKVFERFWQEEQEMSKQYGGTGLGLSISQKIVELLGGEIYVDSTQGKGSVFVFTLPLDRGAKTGRNGIDI
jgi:PAS domain S-box-containing protein